jgi:hypothetical protein
MYRMSRTRLPRSPRRPLRSPLGTPGAALSFLAWIHEESVESTPVGATPLARPPCSRTANQLRQDILVRTEASLRPRLEPRPPNTWGSEGRGFESRRQPPNPSAFAGAAAVVSTRSAMVLLFVRFLCLCESFGSASCLPTIAFTCSVDERSQHCKAVEVVATSNGCLLT